MPTTETLVQSPTIGAIANADLLWVWDVTTSTLNKVTRENLVGGTIAGGGTINLNGQTFTVSSGGTIALNGATFTVPSSGGTAVISAGVSGGQTLIGGTAANDDLTLEGTSNATRTTSYVVLQPNGGNVGIGTTSPNGKFVVSIGASGEAIAARFESTTAKTWDGASNFDNIRFDSRFTGQPIVENVARLTWGFASAYTTNGARIGFDVLNSAGAFVNAMIITGAGNVGIGTTSPSRKLHVAGTILVDGDEGGIAGTIGLTDVNDATLSTGNGTVKLKGTTNRDSAGFIKVYVGTTTVWVPYWTNIT